MSGNGLIPFNDISSTHLLGATLQCSANLRNRKRCGKAISSRKVEEFHQLHDICRTAGGKEVREAEIETLANNLTELAGLALCHLHVKHIETAVHQWKEEIISGVTSDLPEAPESAQKEIVKLNFKRYCNHEFADNPTDDLEQQINKKIDRKVNQKFMDDIRKDSNQRPYVYIISYGGADGAYKVGSTRTISRILDQHERCYPGLIKRQWLHCPNAELFEKLLHAEFTKDRRWHECEKCGKRHHEWFEAPFEELDHCLQTWSEFSRLLYSDDTEVKIEQLDFKIPGGSSDPARWRNWAQKWIDLWSMKSPNSRRRRTASPLPTSPPESPMPGLSPDSDTGTSDGSSYMGPATPTPEGRQQRLNPPAWRLNMEESEYSCFFKVTGPEEDDSASSSPTKTREDPKAGEMTSRLFNEHDSYAEPKTHRPRSRKSDRAAGFMAVRHRRVSASGIFSSREGIDDSDVSGLSSMFHKALSFGSSN